MSPIPDAVLNTNDSSRFECRPTLLKLEPSKCIFTSKMDAGQVIICPSAHAEGKLMFPAEMEDEIYQKLESNGQLVFKYVDPKGNIAGYPWNPNGSKHNIAGICNPAGNVFGMMPHPERVFHKHTHPDWTRTNNDATGDGKIIFESVVEEIAKRF